MRFSRLIIVLTACSLMLPLPARAADLEKPKQDVPVQVHGDAVDYFHEEQKVVGTGHVVIDTDGTRLTADKITVYMATKVAIAEGNVVLTQKGSEFKGVRAEYNFATKIGDVSEMDAKLEPSLYGKAQHIEKISDAHYRASNSYVTTCCGNSPFYRIQAQSVDIYPEKKVVIKNALLFIKGIPILFIPYYVQPLFDFERFPVQLAPGMNSEWGPFLLSKWRYNFVNESSIESKGNILLDYRVRRGLGAGAENYYRGDKIGRGSAKYYYIDDQQPPDDAHSSRYRAQWRHQSKIGQDTTLTTEINKLSDATVMKDFFFREEYEKDAFPDNYVSIITAKPEYTLSVLERERLNEFDTVVERSPEIRLDTHNRQFAETPFYLRQEFQFSNLKKAFANSNEELDVVRFDTNQTLTYAGRVGAISVAPRVGTRQTFYSRQAEDDRDLVRGTFDPGVDISTHFFKTYDIYIKALGLDYNQIRHIFTPTLSYHYRPTPTVSRTLLQQFDSLDTLDKQNFIRFNFENKLQTKQHSGVNGDLQIREIARIIPFLDTDLHTGHLENVGIDAELRPYSWLGIESDAAYNSYTRDIDAYNVDLTVSRPRWSTSVGQRYLRQESSQATGEVKWKISEDVNLKVYERYEFETKKSKEFEITLSKAFSCVIVDFTYNHRLGSGDSFFFVFRLAAYPKASFSMSQSYNSPKTPPVVRA